jgi:hypothetical protein
LSSTITTALSLLRALRARLRAEIIEAETLLYLSSSSIGGDYCGANARGADGSYALL